MKSVYGNTQGFCLFFLLLQDVGINHFPPSMGHDPHLPSETDTLHQRKIFNKFRCDGYYPTCIMYINSTEVLYSLHDAIC